MQSIDTEYAGYRFRSRLEARWAVFFDEADIDYQYEPEGFVLPWRLDGYPDFRRKFRYLPDFWLPDLELWCEVKGSWSAAERNKALNAAAALSSPDIGRDDGHDVLLLPDVFRQPRGGSRRPWRLHMNSGVLEAHPWPAVEGVVEFVAQDSDPAVMQEAPDLLRGYRCDERAPEFYLTAARAAQRARFEFGQTPGRPTL